MFTYFCLLALNKNIFRYFYFAFEFCLRKKRPPIHYFHRAVKKQKVRDSMKFSNYARSVSKNRFGKAVPTKAIQGFYLYAAVFNWFFVFIKYWHIILVSLRMSNTICTEDF